MFPPEIIKMILDWKTRQYLIERRQRFNYLQQKLELLIALRPRPSEHGPFFKIRFHWGILILFDGDEVMKSGTMTRDSLRFYMRPGIQLIR